MAFSPSPMSPPLRDRRSPTPPQPMSKRDKRRHTHITIQSDLHNNFNSERERHYREQLIALQTDMNLVTSADPYGPEPLDDTPDGVQQQIEAAAFNTPYQSELSNLAGTWFGEYVGEVNETKEAKELELINLRANHNARLERLKYEADFRLHLAAEEYESMTNTLRERLVQSLSHKRQKLMKEKEQLDIADTNALLLHPSQFSITNPASPGGHTSRKTRLTRHRGENEEANGLVPEASSKRKRKAAEDDIGSPSRNGYSTPGERVKAANVAHQTGKAYSISQLFTDKELNFQSHQAQIAARHFFSTSHKEGEANGISKRAKEDDEKSGSGDESDKDEDGLEAPGMERTASQNVHVTRSTRNIGGMAGLNILSDLAEKAATRPVLPYATLHTHSTKNGTVLPPVSRLMPEELEEDSLKIAQLKTAPDGYIDKEAYDEAQKPVTGERSTLAPDWPTYMQMHLVDMDPRRAPPVS